MDFQTASNLFKNDKIKELSEDSDGLRFLKLRSLSRRETVEEFARELGIDIADVPARDILKTLFEAEIDEDQIESFIRRKFAEERTRRAQNEDQLINELYKLQVFDWGGLHQNSLEKTIVDNYVKKISNYDTLCDKIDNELQASLRGYVLCSWYNHWTSIIIEDIFKEHPSVLPAIGLVKKIDFFIQDRPFDLKVTYLPEGFLAQARQEEGLRPELTLLKRAARDLNIPFDPELPASKLLEDLWQKVDDHPSDEASTLITELEEFRDSLLSALVEDPLRLLRWLYENQGTRRFDASNRLFLVIVDKTDYHNSWKLKRAKPLLVQKVHSFLDSVDGEIGHDVQFSWEGTTYHAIAEAIFVLKE
jgi:hypothetical protein